MTLMQVIFVHVGSVTTLEHCFRRNASLGIVSERIRTPLNDICERGSISLLVEFVSTCRFRSTDNTPIFVILLKMISKIVITEDSRLVENSDACSLGYVCELNYYKC